MKKQTCAKLSLIILGSFKKLKDVQCVGIDSSIGTSFDNTNHFILICNFMIRENGA